MLGTLTLSGCAFADFFKKKDKGNDTPADTGGGGGEEGGGGEHTEVKFTVTFNVQGHGTAPGSVEVNEGGKVTKPTDPSAEGWTFGGWFKEAACTNAWDFASDTVTANVTLYAKWTENGGGEVTKYTVTFDVQGHGEAPTSVEVDEGGKVTKPTDPSATGWTFGGWFKEAACTNEWDFDNETVSTNVTLYAKWTENAEDLVSVTFNLQGHGENWYVSVKPGETVSKPETDPSATGYTFGGWFKEEGCTTPFDFTEAISADTVIYAKWTEDAPPAPSDKLIDNFRLMGLAGDWTTGQKGVDATDPEKVAAHEYVEQVKFSFKVESAAVEVKLQSGETFLGFAELPEACQPLVTSGENGNIRASNAGDYDLYLKKLESGDLALWLAFEAAEPPVVDVHKLVINRAGEDPIEVNLTLQSESTTEYKVEGQQLQVNDEFVMVVGETTYKYSDLKKGDEYHVGGGVQDLFEEATDGSIKVKAAHKYNLYVQTASEGRGIYTFAAYFQYQEPEGEWLTPDISLKVDPEATDPITEYVIGQDTPIHLAAGTKFLFRIGETWYKFADLKSGVTGINDDGEGNLITTVAGNYTIYCETVADGEGNFIYVVCDADPVETAVSLTVTHGGVASKHNLTQVGTSTEFSIDDLVIEADDTIVIEVDEVEYGYSKLKPFGVSELFELKTEKFTCTETHTYKFFVETDPAKEVDGKAIYVDCEDYFKYSNGDGTIWTTMPVSLKEESEHEYEIPSVALDKGAKFMFNVHDTAEDENPGRSYYKTIKESPIHNAEFEWFDTSESDPKVLVGGTYHIYCQTPETDKEVGLYITGAVDASRNYVEIIRHDDGPSDPAEHYALEFKEEGKVFYDEFMRRETLEAGDKIRFMVNGAWAELFKDDDPAAANFKAADEAHYLEVKAECGATFDFYIGLLTTGKVIWVQTYTAPVPVAHNIIFDQDWVASEDAEIYVWVWGSGVAAHWEKLEIQESLGTKYAAVTWLSSVSGFKVYRFNKAATHKPVVNDPEAEGPGDFTKDVEYWNCSSSDVAVNAETENIHVNNVA